jgi:hypothetical protein
VNHLAGSMNPCIGAAGRNGPNRTMGVEGLDRSLQGLLHAGQGGLTLPTMKRGTVVLEADRDPAQRSGQTLQNRI